jgi:hypothetical protein
MDETQLSEFADAAQTEVRTRAERKTDLAWSQGEPEEPAEFIEPRRTTVLLWTYVVVAALAVAALVGVWYTHRSTDAPTSAVEAPQTVLPSPEDVIVPSVAPKPVTPPPYTAADDQRFLNRLKELGSTIYKPQLVLETAHMTCDQFRAGKTIPQVQTELITALGGVTKDTADQFASSATMTYPDCG